MSELEPERTKGARYTVGGAERTRRVLARTSCSLRRP